MQHFRNQTGWVVTVFLLSLFLTVGAAIPARADADLSLTVCAQLKPGELQQPATQVNGINSSNLVRGIFSDVVADNCSGYSAPVNVNSNGKTTVYLFTDCEKSLTSAPVLKQVPKIKLTPKQDSEANCPTPAKPGPMPDQEQREPQPTEPIAPGPTTPSEEEPAESNPAETETSESNLNIDEQNMLALVNQERAKVGLQSLQSDPELVKLARMKAQDMIDNNYFSHTSPTYGSPFDMMQAAGVRYHYAGENLAGASTVDIAHTSLMNSSGHRDNLLNANYNKAGIGVVDGGPYGKMFVQMFTD